MVLVVGVVGCHVSPTSLITPRNGTDLERRCIFEGVWIYKFTSYRYTPDEFDQTFADVRKNTINPPITPSRAALLRNVAPVPVHSHNDYWRAIPLYEALGSGCISVEADVWLSDNDLFVGHVKKALRSERTLKAMYLDPITSLIKQANSNTTSADLQGIFSLDPSQTLVLLIDHKSLGSPTYAALYSQLQELRDLDWLTFWNGTHRVERPLTVVASGNAPFSSVIANETYRDIFFDAPLDRLVQSADEAGNGTAGYVYNPTNSWYASTKLDRAIGKIHPNTIKVAQIDTIGQQIEEASQRGLISRYWDTPAKSIDFRNNLWDIFLAKNIGILNIDDMAAVRARGWGKWPYSKISANN